MRVHITDLKPGDRLARDTFNDLGLLILSKGTVLNDSALSFLGHHPIEFLDIERRPSGAAAHSEDDTLLHADVRPLYEGAITGIRQIFERALEEGKVNEEDLKETIQPLLDQVIAERDVIYLLLLLNSQDDYTYRHSVQVGMLCFYLARWMGWDDERSIVAGNAGFLHDIGKCRIPGAILTKPGKLSEEELREIRNHAQYGYEILQNSFDDDVVAIAALQHHERMNGAGYPMGLTSENIHPVARMVAVADTYSAMISSRVYQKKKDLFSVLKELYRVSFTELDPDVVHTFIRHMLPNFIGKTVRLKSGITGTIIMNHPTDFFLPLIQVSDGFIDLSRERHHEIAQILL